MPCCKHGIEVKRAQKAESCRKSRDEWGGFPTQTEATTPMFARISWKALESECLPAYPGQHRTTRITSPEVHSFSLGCCPTLPRKERLAGQFFARNWGKDAAGTTATNLSAVTWVTAGEQLWKHSTSFNKSATDHNRSPNIHIYL